MDACICTKTQQKAPVVGHVDMTIYILPSSIKASFLAGRSGELCDIYHGIGARVGHLEVMHLPSFSTLHLLIGTSATQQTKYKIAAVAAHCRYCYQVAL